MTASPRCARTACKAPLEPGHTYFNRSTRQHYCERCAVWLNDANREDAMRLYGGPLCVLEQSPNTEDQP